MTLYSIYSHSGFSLLLITLIVFIVIKIEDLTDTFLQADVLKQKAKC